MTLRLVDLHRTYYSVGCGKGCRRRGVKGRVCCHDGCCTYIHQCGDDVLFARMRNGFSSNIYIYIYMNESAHPQKLIHTTRNPPFSTSKPLVIALLYVLPSAWRLHQNVLGKTSNERGVIDTVLFFFGLYIKSAPRIFECIKTRTKLCFITTA